MSTPVAYELSLSPATLIAIKSADGSKAAVIDIFEAWRHLDKSQTLPSEDKRWESNRAYLASKLGTTLAEISEGEAREFNEVIIRIGTRIQEDIAKKVNGMLS